MELMTHSRVMEDDATRYWDLVLNMFFFLGGGIYGMLWDLYWIFGGTFVGFDDTFMDISGTCGIPDCQGL